METVLITGGAGYIGYNTVRLFQKNNINVVSLDNMSRGNKWAKGNVTFIEGDIDDSILVKSLIKKYKVKTVIHFAAFAYVYESIQNPEMYFNNNVVKSLKFIEAVTNAGIDNFIFSSSCAVYGNPKEIPITEQHDTSPINPYGETKLFIEKALHWYSIKYNLNYVVLRYFNAAGASFLFKSGEYHRPETHLIPLLIQSVLDKKSKFKIFGDTYDTSDGTAVRDFIHIDDLSHAHYLAYNYIKKENKNIILNLGTGQGYSILEIINFAEIVIKKKIDYELKPKRKGDPPILIANYETANKLIGWSPSIGIKKIIESAYLWETNTLPSLLEPSVS
tara:strand:- start:6897 stop:7895 length:999 start_codon:yes stop_codon:yes gene_type:complete